MTNRGATAGTISKKTGAYIIPEGYHNGDGSVTIAEAERDKIIPGNIKRGISILGVSGTYTGDGTGGTEVDKTGKGEYVWAKYTELIGWVKTSEDVGKDRPSGYSTTEYTGATITEDGYYKLDNSIGINKYYLPTGATNGKTKSVLYRPYGYRTDYYVLTLSDEKGATGKKGTDLLGYISSDSSDSYPNAGVQDGVYYLAVSAPDVNAIASKMLENTVACGPDGKVTGTIKRLTAQTITPGTEDQNIDAGVYLSGKQTIKGDANLLAENIKEGVELFGITGTYTGGDTVNPYKGKTIVGFGDSVFAGWGWKEGTGIIQPLKEKYPDATWINKAESGANMAVTSSPAHTPIVNQITTYTGAADAIIFDGGVNDINNSIPIGSIESGYDASYNTGTFCGAMESALQYIMDRYPLAVKLYIIPHSFAKDNSYVDSIYSKAIEICEKWNMPYLDMRVYSQIAMTSANKDKYTYNPNSKKGDGVHPNETWYRTFYSPVVDQALQNQGIGSITASEAPEVVAVTGVKLDQTTLTLDAGDSAQLTATVSPGNATNKSVTWSASNNRNQNNGTIIRNGVIYRNEQTDAETCVLNWDGTMDIYQPGQVELQQLIEKGAYQSWVFGPSLLDEKGKAKDKFLTWDYIRESHPRTAIGYYEPGHYCLLLVDGRQDSSRGMFPDEMAKVFEELGCKAAYNLDGGHCSFMTFLDKVANHPYKPEHEVADGIFITEGL